MQNREFKNCDLKPESVSIMSTDMYIECAKEKLSRLKSEMYDLQKHIEELSQKQEKQNGRIVTPSDAKKYIQKHSNSVDELVGRHILFDDCTIGRIVGANQTATYNKVYKVCDSLEPLNIQVLDEDFVKGGLIDESLEKYMKDEHLGRDFTGVMFQELSNVVREQMGLK